MATDPALVAHVLRRLTFGPRPGDVERHAAMDLDQILEQILGAEPYDPEGPEFGTDDDYSVLVRWWLTTMASPEANLHERMVWNWHGHLTSSLTKAEPGLMYRQHRVLREHALGNFRDLMQAIAVDAAMLYWLDGSGSLADSPNENFGREAMELFTLGHGVHSEADVRGAAVAFSGYWVDGDNGSEVRFDPDAGPRRPVELLGTSVADAASAIDAMCDHPACAPYIAAKIYSWFAGEQPDDDLTTELAAVFVAADLEIRPLVAAIVSDRRFLDAAPRPRSPVEWILAAHHFMDIEIDPWTLATLGQVPFEPPNVAGWPTHDRWVSAGATFTKAQIAWDQGWDTDTLDRSDPISDLLTRAALVDVGDATRDVLQRATQSIESRREQSTLLHALLALSPEFSLT